MNRKILNIALYAALATGLTLTSCVDREDPAMPTGYIPDNSGNNNPGGGNDTPGGTPDSDPGNKLPEFTKPETAAITINGNKHLYYKDSHIALTTGLAATAPGYTITGFTINGSSKKIGDLVAIEPDMRIRAITSPTSMLSLSEAADILAKAKAGDIINLEVTNLNSANISELGAAVKKSAAKVNLTIPDGSTTRIPASAFAGCANLTSVSLPAGLIMIESNAFQGCTSLANVAFNGTGSLPLPGDPAPKAPERDPDALNTAIQNLYTSAGTQTDLNSLIPVRPGQEIYQLNGRYYKLSGDNSALTFSEIYFGDGVWWKDSKLSEPMETGIISALQFISHPQKETTMLFGKAFDGCGAIQAISLPDNISEISAETFARCGQLTFIIIENRAIKIDDKAFLQPAEGAVVSVSGSMSSDALNTLKNIFGPKNVVSICD